MKKSLHANHWEDECRQHKDLEEELFLVLRFPSSLVSQLGEVTPQKFTADNITFNICTSFIHTHTQIYI